MAATLLATCFAAASSSAGAGAGAQTPRLRCACGEQRDYLPATTLRILAEARPAPDLAATYTAVPVAIDMIGAAADPGWTVHSAINVRGGPSTTFPLLGSLAVGSVVAGVYTHVTETDQEWIRIAYNGNPEAWISATGVYRPHPLNLADIATYGNLPFAANRVNRWWANPSTYVASDLKAIPAQYTTQEGGKTYLLRSDAVDSLVQMFDAAQEDGVRLRALSCYRSWSSQRSIYNSAVSTDGLAQRYSAPPGHSEHQLGTTLDISHGTRVEFIDDATPEHDWLARNASRFGWSQSYTKDNVATTGYIEEPWHWRYWGESVTQRAAWIAH